MRLTEWKAWANQTPRALVTGAFMNKGSWNESPSSSKSWESRLPEKSNFFFNKEKFWSLILKHQIWQFNQNQKKTKNTPLFSFLFWCGITMWGTEYIYIVCFLQLALWGITTDLWWKCHIRLLNKNKSREWKTLKNMGKYFSFLEVWSEKLFTYYATGFCERSYDHHKWYWDGCKQYCNNLEDGLPSEGFHP